MSLAILSVAVPLLLKWYAFQKHQQSVWQQRRNLIRCTQSFVLWIKEQPNIKSCVETRYARQNTSSGEWVFERKPSSECDFKIEVENTAWVIEKGDDFCFTRQGEQTRDVSKSPKKTECLTVRFYAFGKTHCLHTCFVPVTTVNDKYESRDPADDGVERFMLTPEEKPRSEKTGNTQDL